jgi:predicted lipoprotein with Yx(FWY)xxD motif
MKNALIFAGFALALSLASCSTTSAPPASDTTVSLGAGTLDGVLIGGQLSNKPSFTLYKFAKDTQGATVSACNGACATNWPPLTVASAAALVSPSAAPKILATITRGDGTVQVTYDGWPLYFYAGDSAAGSSNGSTVPNWSLASK